MDVLLRVGAGGAFGVTDSLGAYGGTGVVAAPGAVRAGWGNGRRSESPAPKLVSSALMTPWGGAPGR